MTVINRILFLALCHVASHAVCSDAGCQVTAKQDQDPKPIGQIDATRSFFVPPFAAARGVLARAGGTDIGLVAYKSWLLSQAGRSLLEDFAFDMVLARECAALKVARGAEKLCVNRAMARGKSMGLNKHTDPFFDSRRRLANEELRALRVAALVKLDRRPTEQELRRLFHHEYGVDGTKVVVRQIWVSFNATERQIDPKLTPRTRQMRAHAIARAKARKLHERIKNGEAFAAVLPESDDPLTRAQLADPRFAKRAGIVPGYNYQRFGTGFAKAVRDLKAGEISAPVKTTHGWHIIDLVSRKETKFEDVQDALAKSHALLPPTHEEARVLRERLFTKHGVEFGK
ncbi:MAG: peptidylprolyl isomerase [Planctomycetota bacterium]|jgi:hypothetical protein|nr:peptidylprolyl isomerase [Planctomycetota bacterium]